MAKKTTTKKAVKTVAAKKAVKTVAVKKTAPKASTSAALEEVPAKKVVAKKVGAKKAPAAKASTSSAPKAPTSSAPKAPTSSAPKAPTSSAPKKAAPAKQVVKTSIIARVDVGFGNSLYIRGEGAGLSWDKGVQLDNTSPYEWTFSSTKAKGDVTFKFLINDEIWSESEDLTVAAGGTSISSPTFAW